MKSAVMKFMHDTGIYQHIRYSGLYYKLLKIKNPTYLKDLENDFNFYQNAFGKKLNLIFDVGANWGDKTYAFKKLSDRVVSVEPDQNCFRALNIRYGNNKQVALEQVALGDSEGVATFFVEEDGSAYNTLSVKQKEWLLENHQPKQLKEVNVKVTTLDHLVGKYGTPDYIKIDVEGFELPVLKGLSELPPIISFEANLPHFQEETLAILDLLIKDGKKDQLFNLRYVDDFVFEIHQPIEKIVLKIKEGKEITYDVFVFTPR